MEQKLIMSVCDPLDQGCQNPILEGSSQAGFFCPTRNSTIYHRKPSLLGRHCFHQGSLEEELSALWDRKRGSTAALEDWIWAPLNSEGGCFGVYLFFQMSICFTLYSLCQLSSTARFLIDPCKFLTDGN